MYCKCTHCGDVHRLCNRVAIEGTTKCPSCGDKQYRSGVDPEADVDEDEQMRSLLRDVDGVGTRTMERIVAHYAHVEALANVGEDSLTDIPHVGPETASNIHDAAVNTTEN